MIHNERIKLLATALNNLGLAFAIGGFVAPALSGRLLLIQFAWFAFGAGVHVCGQAVLGRLTS